MTKLGGKYSKPADGIPVNDLSAAVQTSLTKADTAIQSLDGYATETFVENKVADLVNSAPETLDTLGELAAAFEDNQEVVEALDGAISNKVDKVEGKGLSSNDFTTAEKEKLAGLNNITVDSSLSSTSTNPVENKAIYSGIYDPKYSIKLKDSYGDTFVLKIENNTLITAKVPIDIIVGQLNKTEFYDGDYFTLNDCPEVTGVFYGGNTVLDKNDVQFALYWPPDYWAGVGINASNSAFLARPGKCKLKIACGGYEKELFITVLELPTLFNSYFEYYNWATTIQNNSFNASLIDLNKKYKMIFDLGDETTTSYPVTISYCTQEDGYDENKYEFYCPGVYYSPYDAIFDATIIYYESSGTTEMQIYSDYDISISGSVRLAEDMQEEEK
jgi:hypothetical protein